MPIVAAGETASDTHVEQLVSGAGGIGSVVEDAHPVRRPGRADVRGGAAREPVPHTLYAMVGWFDRRVKA